MKRLFLSIILVLLTASGAWGAAQTAYFADNGAGNISGDWNPGSECTEASPCNTLAEAQTVLDDFVDIGNTLTMYFAKDDTWLATTPNRNISGVVISDWSSARDCVLLVTKNYVTIDAYGSGADPIFDGQETFSSCPLTTRKNKSDAVILIINNDGFTIRNVTIKNFHGNGIYFHSDSTNNLVEYCTLTKFGSSAVRHTIWSDAGALRNTTVRYNDISFTGETPRSGSDCDTSWSGAIAFQGGDELSGTWGGVYNTKVYFNRIDESGGEGIVVGSYEDTDENVIEYNVISNTDHVAIHTPTSGGDAGKIRARYNLIYWEQGRQESGSYGFYVYDEFEGVASPGDNSSSDHEYYGNTVINGLYGVWIAPREDAWGKVWFYNNTFIDCEYSIRHDTNIGMSNFRYYNNAHIYYSETGSHVTTNTGATSTGWVISHNAFYGGDGAPALWQTSQVTGDPKLGKTSGWMELVTIPAFSDLLPASDSALVDAGTTLAYPYTNQFLVTGTDFSDLPATATFLRKTQDEAGDGWEIGAIIREDPVTYPNGAITVSGNCPVSVNEGTAVTFQGGASGGSGSGYTYYWDFDGAATTSTAQNPANTFSVVGNYTVSLTVTDGAGRADPTPATCGLTILGTGGDGDYVLVQSVGSSDDAGSAFCQATPTLYVAAAKFTASGNHSVKRISAMLETQGSPTGTVTAKIYEDDGGYPDPDALVTNATSDALAAGSIPASAGFVNFEFSTAPTLTASAVYHLVLVPSQTGSDTNYFLFRRTSGGSGIRRGNSALSAWTSSIAYDGIFELYSYQEEEEPTVPQVLSITTAESDGTYGDEDVIGPFTLTFSEAVDVTGSPYITMELGTTDANCAYSSGTGTTAIVFAAFTVAAASNHTTNDLDAKTPLVLNSGTIIATDDDEPASLILPTGSTTPGALAFGSDIVISTDAPTIVSILPVSDRETYDSTSDVIYFKVRCSKPIYAVGVPYFAKIPVRLDYPAITLYAYYVSGSGTTDLLFQLSGFYAGYRESDLDYYGEAPEIALDGGTLKDEADADLILTLPTTGRLGDVADYVIAIPQGTGNTVTDLGFLTDGDTVSGTETSTFDLSAYYGYESAEIDIVIDNWTLASGSNVLGDYYRFTGRGLTGNLTIGDYCTMTDIKRITGTITVGAGCVLTRCGQ